MTPQQTIALKLRLADAYIHFEKGLMVHAKFRVNDSAVCDELVQDTFVKTWNYLVREGKIDLMKPFLYHILNCLIIDEYRKHKYVSLDQLMGDGFELRDDVIERHINELDGASLIALVNALPVSYARVLKMRYLENLTLEEISHQIGVTKNTVAVQVHRGLTKLRVAYVAEASQTLAGL